MQEQENQGWLVDLDTIANSPPQVLRNTHRYSQLYRLYNALDDLINQDVSVKEEFEESRKRRARSNLELALYEDPRTVKIDEDSWTCTEDIDEDSWH